MSTLGKSNLDERMASGAVHDSRSSSTGNVQLFRGKDPRELPPVVRDSQVQGIGGRLMDWIEEYSFPVKLGAGFLAALWSGLPGLTQFLLVLMGIDILFGVWLAFQTKTVNPTKAWAGVTKKVGTLVLVGLTALFHSYVPFEAVDLTQASSAFYIVAEMLSITRNAVRLGIVVPPQFEQILTYFEGFTSEHKDKDK